MDSNQTTVENRESLQNILTEKEVMDLTGLTKNQLAILRTEEHLPFLKVNRNCRLYLESDLVGWLKGRKVIMNRNE